MISLPPEIKTLLLCASFLLLALGFQAIADGIETLKNINWRKKLTTKTKRGNTIDFPKPLMGRRAASDD